jgi:hypothetical protein
MAEVGKAFVSIVPVMGGAGRKIASELDGTVGKAGDTAGKKAGGRFGAAFKGAAAAGVATAGAAVAIKLIKDAVAEAREAQKVGATTNAIIKSTGGVANVTAAGISKLSESISNKTGMDDEAIQTGANLLLTFKNVRNEAGKGNKVFDAATQAAVDLSAAGFGSVDGAAKMLGKALNDPIKGISALGRAGVTFTQQQKDQIKTLVESGDVLGAQKIILGEVQSQVGGVAAASATSGEKLKTTFNNFKESIGTALLPTIDAFNGKMIQLFGWLNKNRPVVVVLAAVVGGILVGAFVALAVAVIAATWPFILAGIAVGLLVAGFIYAWKHSERFRIAVRFLGAAAVTAGALFLRMGASVVSAIAYILGALGKIKSDKFQWARDGSVALEGVATKLNAGAVKADELAKKLNTVPKKTNADVKTSKLDKPVKDTATLGKNIKGIPGTKNSKVSVSSLTKSITDSKALGTNITKIPGSKKATVSVSSMKPAITEAKNLKTAIDNLKSKTITITTKYEQSGTPPKTASGGIFSGAQTRVIGEAGAEAVVPLDRPLNMVDPSVRWLAAYAQGKTNLSGMAPLTLDGSFGATDGASAGPAPVYVVNPGDIGEAASNIADRQIAAQDSFASTMGRMG